MILIPHVTEAIGYCNQSAFANIPPDTLAAAQDRGSAFHELAAGYASKVWIPEIPIGLGGFFQSFTRWFDKYVEKTVVVERRFHHSALFYEGTPDWIGIIKGDEGLTLIDWKTPAFASKGWRLQLAAYKALVENNGLLISRVASLQPRRDGKAAKFKDYPGSLTSDLTVFMSVLNVWRFFNDK
jgi:hypothetical protein